MIAVNTPLDSLKNAVLRATDSMDGATDTIGGSMCGHDHENELEWFDSIERDLWLTLAEHVPGVTWNGHMVEMTPEALQAVHHYDDGSLIDEWVELREGASTTRYFRRLDGPKDEFIAKFDTPQTRTALSLVPPVGEVI